MKIIKEYSAVSCFPLEMSNSCFFHIKGEYCCLSSSERKLYKSIDEDIVCLNLVEEYRKIFYHGGSPEYFAYTWVKQRNEIFLHFLDQHMRSFDMMKLRIDSTGGVEDMWLDRHRGFLYFVFPFSIQVYNLNGDLLHPVLRAPANTQYKAVCCDKDRMFVAYERFGCTYVAEYDCCGVFKEKLGIGSCLSAENMEIIHSDSEIILNLYGNRQGRVTVCVELLIETPPCSQIETSGNPLEPSKDQLVLPEEKKIYVELSKADGVGCATCHLSSLGHKD